MSRSVRGGCAHASRAPSTESRRRRLFRTVIGERWPRLCRSEKECLTEVEGQQSDFIILIRDRSPRRTTPVPVPEHRQERFRLRRVICQLPHKVDHLRAVIGETCKLETSSRAGHEQTARERLTLMVTVCKPEKRASVPTSVLLPQACHSYVQRGTQVRSCETMTGLREPRTTLD